MGFLYITREIMQYIFSVLVLIASTSSLYSMQSPLQVQEVISFDENLPFTPQAIRIYKLPKELLEVLEKPLRPENYAENLKVIRAICLSVKQYLDINLDNEPALNRVRRQNGFVAELRRGCFPLYRINEIAEREDWMPAKNERVIHETRVACGAAVIEKHKLQHLMDR